MGPVPRAPAWPVPPSASSEWSTEGQPRFSGASVPPHRFRTCCPVLRGRAQLEGGLLFEFLHVGTWSARARSRAYSSAG